MEGGIRGDIVSCWNRPAVNYYTLEAKRKQRRHHDLSVHMIHSISGSYSWSETAYILPLLKAVLRSQSNPNCAIYPIFALRLRHGVTHFSQQPVFIVEFIKSANRDL